ncbi:hypothetical protein CAPGI0001_2605 [Capnocytophaga gingivalis ATCC 33624]|nr:hypothetical protein CAPGI0001_2605 [Capnocytophaga gingivalis ATCC 33624]
MGVITPNQELRKRQPFNFIEKLQASIRLSQRRRGNNKAKKY